MVELHRKVDELSAYIKDEKPEFVKLDTKAKIEAIGFEHFKLDRELLQSGKEYYGRISMPTFPKREMPLSFVALDSKIGEIKLLHEPR